MPKTVVVPLDGSTFAERALRPAAEVARRAGAHVVVMTARYGGVVVEPKRYLEEAARRAGIEDAEPVVVDGRLAASAISAVVSEHADAAVAMTTHARERLGRALFGSVADEILREANDATLLIGPSAPDEPMRPAELIVCLDGSEVADAILPFAAAWARDLHLDVVLLRVSEADPEPGRDALLKGHLTRSGNRLVRLGLAPGHGSVRCEVLHNSDAAEAILQFSCNHSHAVLALTTHGRTGLARLTAGSIAIAVVREAQNPVLLTRPAGLD
jgi:nucleotide-binding universal stress UspA family protein